jgi:cyclase
MGSMSKMPPPRVEEVAEGIYAYVQPDGTWFLNNTGIFVGKRSTILVDQCGTVERGRALMAAADRLSAGPVEVLVNTHHHGDHTFGNFLVSESACIIGHRLTREEVIATGTTITALFAGPEWGDIEVRPPDVTFEQDLTLWLDETEIRLLHFGRPAHTTNDTVVWIPDLGVVFAGDLAFNGGTPFALQGSITGWLKTLNEVRALGATTVVPGHGAVTGPEVFDDAERYLTFVWDTAVAAREAGLSPLEAAREVDLGQFADLSDPERIVGNLHRAYAELAGEPPGAPIDLMAAAGDMMQYHGGPIVSRA